jgi:hypothetical protein
MEGRTDLFFVADIFNIVFIVIIIVVLSLMLSFLIKKLQCRELAFNSSASLTAFKALYVFFIFIALFKSNNLLNIVWYSLNPLLYLLLW